MVRTDSMVYIQLNCENFVGFGDNQQIPDSVCAFVMEFRAWYKNILMQLLLDHIM